MNKIKKYYIGILTLVCMTLLYSCDDSYPKTTESPYDTDLLEATLFEGTKKFEGTIDEAKKEISFKRFPLKTDFSALELETKVSEGAALVTQNIDLSMADDEEKKTIVLRVEKNKRYKEYQLTIEKKLPPRGADFKAVKVYDHSIRTTVYPDMSADLTRCADMDNEHVLIVSRGTSKLHLLSIEDLRNGEVKPIILPNAPFASWAGGIAHGHVYGVNLPNPSGGGSVQLLHWADAKNLTEETKPETKVITADELKAIGYDQAGRFGDYMSVNINERGSGSIFLGINGSMANYKILQIKIKNFSEITDKKFLNPDTYAGFWAAFNQVDGSPSDYLYSGHQATIKLTDASGKITHSIGSNVFPIGKGSDAHIITFNKARYLIASSCPGAVKLEVYDITRGETTKDALKILENTSGLKTIYDYTIGGDVPANLAAGITAWSVSKDGESLFLLTGAPNVGFSLLEFPKSTKELDDDDEETTPEEGQE